ncbi:hypothetical protein KJZ63_01885 [Patescibacteria group bacterium]|nr:hypothetical protein [Patescibacteria group bacterium]
MRKLITALSLFAILTGIFAPTIFAQAAAQEQPNTDSAQNTNTQAPVTDESITLTAMPPRLGDDLSLKGTPGKKLQTAVKVRNNSNKAFTINTAIDDFVIGDDGETPVAVTEEVDYRWSLKNWLVLAPDFQVLQPRQTGIINVIIDVPADALPGGHYAMITHKPVGLNGEKFQDSASSIISQRVGTLLYVVVDGPINEEAFVRDFTMPRFTEYGPVPFSFMVDNQSDIHIKPEISIEIYNLLGMKVDTIAIESKNVFPMVSRTFTGQWDAVWGSGFYKAKLIMSYGTGGQVAIVNTTFWLLPITLVIAGLVVILTLVVIFIAVRRHLLHKKDAEKQRMQMLEEKIAKLEQDRLSKFDE